MFTYQTKGELKGAVKDLDSARAYLRADDMTQYMPESLDAVVKLEWDLLDTVRWVVTATTTRELVEAELADLASYVSGQNSDGLGEGFEQQPFAELYDDSYDEDEDDYYGMASFDWETNDCTFARI